MPRKRVIGAASAEPGHAAQVVQRGRDDVDARVRIVDPVDRHLVDAHPAPLRQDQQFGVEEPALVAHGAEQFAHDVAAHRLEPALRVAEPCSQDGAQNQVVGARDELTLGAADDPGAGGQARSDRHLAVPR